MELSWYSWRYSIHLIQHCFYPIIKNCKSIKNVILHHCDSRTSHAKHHDEHVHGAVPRLIFQILFYIFSPDSMFVIISEFQFMAWNLKIFCNIIQRKFNGRCFIYCLPSIFRFVENQYRYIFFVTYTNIHMKPTGLYGFTTKQCI